MARPPPPSPGQAGDPYRYWLAEQEAKWAADPLRQFERQQAEDRRLLKEQFGIDLGQLDQQPGW
jgi:hypothetical protein